MFTLSQELSPDKCYSGTSESSSIMPTSTLGQKEMATAKEIMITAECEQFHNSGKNFK